MHLATISTALLVLAQNILAVPVDSQSPALDVKLTQIGNTRVKAVVKNVGSEDITFVHLNFLGDSAPVEKAAVYRNSMGPLQGPALMLTLNRPEAGVPGHPPPISDSGPAVGVADHSSCRRDP